MQDELLLAATDVLGKPGLCRKLSTVVYTMVYKFETRSCSDLEAQL